MNNLKETIKNKQGITLISLVVTIVILLILAGVSIAMLVGDNGIINQASRAKEASKKAGIIEEIKIDIATKQTKNLGNINETEIYNILNKYGSIDGDILKTGNLEIKISEIWQDFKIERTSNNIVNPSTIKYGKYNSNNTELSHDEWSCTPPIEVESNTNYISNRCIGFVTCYDQEENYIGKLTLDDDKQASTLTKGFTTPENCKFIIISFHNKNIATVTNENFMEFVWVGKNQTNNIVYEPYGTVNYSEGIPNKLDKNRILYDTVLHSGIYFTYALNLLEMREI